MIWPAYGASLDSQADDAGGFQAPPNSTNIVYLTDGWSGFFCVYMNHIVLVSNNP
jgi:hypothetical protein